MRAHYGYNYRQELHPYPLLAGDPQSVYNQPGMDSYGRDYYPRRVLNPPPLAIRTPQDIRSQPLAIKAVPEDNNIKEISDLQQKFKELSVQLANAREKRPKATNQGTNVWCTIVVDRDICLVNVRLPLLIKERIVVIVGVEGMI
jgi:hypothetical protein